MGEDHSPYSSMIMVSVHYKVRHHNYFHLPNLIYPTTVFGLKLQQCLDFILVRSTSKYNYSPCCKCFIYTQNDVQL